jgi:hypothetical protein
MQSRDPISTFSPYMHNFLIPFPLEIFSLSAIPPFLSFTFSHLPLFQKWLGLTPLPPLPHKERHLIREITTATLRISITTRTPARLFHLYISLKSDNQRYDMFHRQLPDNGLRMMPQRINPRNRGLNIF